MNSPPTMLVREEDDERTLVDSRFSVPDPSSDTTVFLVDPTGPSDPEPPFEGSGRAVPLLGQAMRTYEPAEKMRLRWQDLWSRFSARRFVEASAVLALVLGLGTVAHQQRRVADALRATIDELQTRSFESPVLQPFGHRSQTRAPATPEKSLAAATPEFAADKRELLESRGASLVGSNDFLGALAHYQMLVQLFPNEGVFRDVVTVLEAKLRCERLIESASGACPTG